MNARLVSRYLGDAIEIAEENREMRRLLFDLLEWVASRDDLGRFANDLIEKRFPRGSRL